MKKRNLIAMTILLTCSALISSIKAQSIPEPPSDIPQLKDNTNVNYGEQYILKSGDIGAVNLNGGTIWVAKNYVGKINNINFNSGTIYNRGDLTLGKLHQNGNSWVASNGKLTIDGDVEMQNHNNSLFIADGSELTVKGEFQLTSPTSTLTVTGCTYINTMSLHQGVFRAGVGSITTINGLSVNGASRVSSWNDGIWYMNVLNQGNLVNVRMSDDPWFHLYLGPNIKYDPAKIGAHTLEPKQVLCSQKPLPVKMSSFKAYGGAAEFEFTEVVDVEKVETEISTNAVDFTPTGNVLRNPTVGKHSLSIKPVKK